MLQRLVIRNYAIIDHLEFEPDHRLNTITGETGAGKSIILGALSLILGERADTSVLINKSEKCVVEAYFDVAGNVAFKSALRAAELDEDDQCIIRREITAAGKSRAFINDTPVTLSTLNRLTSLLVDLHQQFGHLALEDDHFQMDVVDAIAGNFEERKAYEAEYAEYRSLDRKLAALQTRQAQWQKEADYKQFLLDELAQAALQDNEIETAEQQLKQLEHAERIISILQGGKAVLEEGEQPIIGEIRRLVQQLQSISDVMEGVKPLQERMQSVYAELRDIADEFDSLSGRVNIDPEMMHQLQQRIDLGYKLCKKHGVSTTSELLAIQAGLEADLQETLHLDESICALLQQKEQSNRLLTARARTLSEKRKEAAPKMAAEVNKLLHLVGMPNARLQVMVTALSALDSFGSDRVSFLLDANKSGQALPVYKAASGGEMSRIMLCIKSLTAKAMHLPTLIFDELDTGISGEAARQVGQLLASLGQHHQVVCITHQPQVAARGQKHFFVFKEMDGAGRMRTQLRALQSEERIKAIAQMIGGENPSDAALQNAKELVLT